MARVTVEDCIMKVSNRFELVLLTAQRGRDISAGAPLTIERDNDKTTVVSLREIAESKVDVDELRMAVIQGLQKTVDFDEPEDDAEMEAIELELAEAAMSIDLAQEMRADSLNEHSESENIDPADAQIEE